MKKRLLKMMVVMVAMLTMIFTSQISALAAAPTIEDIEHKGNGRIDVDFYGDVQYKNVKIIVKDSKGNSYKVKNIYKDDDDIKFTIKNFKRGRTYKITVKGVREMWSSKYGKVSGKIKIPAASKGSKISSSKAISKAKSNAKNKWGAKNFWDVEVESDWYGGEAVWEVSFNGTIKGSPYEFEYKIAKKGGKILRYEKEYDD